jgi:hypothetical protein
VNPQTQPDLKIVDPSLRLTDYVNAITSWSQATCESQDQIWVLENTNSISALESAFLETQLDCSRVKFIQIPFDNQSQNHGKSAGEFEMLKYLSHKVIEGKFEYVIKITGRLFVKNFKQCLAKNPNVDFLCGRFYQPSHIVDSRFFCVTPHTYELIFGGEVSFSTRLKESRDLNEKTFLSMEHYLTYCAFQLESLGFLVKSFPAVPLYIGQSASTGKKLDSPVINLKIRMSNSVRKVAIKFLTGYTP